MWENVFGAWVGWNERDKALLRAMLAVQRRYAGLLDARASGRRSPRRERRTLRVVGSRWSDGETTLWALANRGASVRGRAGRSARRSTLPAGGIAAVARRRSSSLSPAGGDGAFPAREAVRVRVAGRTRRRRAGRIRRGAAAAAADRRLPPPRDRHLRRGAVRRGVEAAAAAAARLRRGRASRAGAGGSRSSRREEAARTGSSSAEARAYAAERGARLPTEDEWQLAAEAGLLEPLGAARVELDGERALRRPHALRDTQGRLGLEGARARTGTSTAARRSLRTR